MTFAKQYEQALTILSVSSQESTLQPQYFAGDFYELLDSAAYHIPTVLSGGSVEITIPCTLSFHPLECRMLLYTEDGEGTLCMHGTSHALQPGSLLYLNCQDSSFTLSPAQSFWRFICFSLGGGFLTFMSLWFPSKHSPLSILTITPRY